MKSIVEQRAVSGFLTGLYDALIISSREHYRRRSYYMLINEEVSDGDFSKKSSNRNTIEWAMQVLPVGYRHVLVLHDVLGYDAKRIWNVLQITEGACEHQLFNARKSIRQLLPDLIPFRTCEHLTMQIQIVRSAFNKELLPAGLVDTLTSELFELNLIDNSSQQFSLFKFLLPGVSALTALINLSKV